MRLYFLMYGTTAGASSSSFTTMRTKRKFECLVAVRGSFLLVWNERSAGPPTVILEERRARQRKIMVLQGVQYPFPTSSSKGTTEVQHDASTNDSTFSRSFKDPTRTSGGTTPSPIDKEDTTNKDQRQHLRLMVLGCEQEPPYGPNHHTATLLLDLIGQAIEQCSPENDESSRIGTVTLKIYNVQAGEYPTSAQEWNEFDGVIIPGSFSSAYDDDAWIHKLKHTLQEHIVQAKRPTLAICFGHQIMAHSFPVGGQAMKVPTGPRAGRCTSKLTREGSYLLGIREKDVELYFSHGDMVGSLPPTAVALGGSERVPVEIAAYFGSIAEVEALKDAARREDDAPTTARSTIRPFAITFQAHPEYAASVHLGVEQTLEKVMDAMHQRGNISCDERVRASQDAAETYPMVHKSSVDLMIKAGKLLQWFP